MDIQPPDYDRIEQELWEKHKTEVRDMLEEQDDGLLRRIRTFAEHFGFDEMKVREKIENDLMFACCFAKDATKTGFQEKEAGKYLKKFPELIQSFKLLPKTGKNAKYMDEDGNIVTGEKPENGSKSLDFMWTVDNTHIECFASHKFTREGGGAQNHQRDELIRLLKMFKNCNNKRIALFAICDGPYYNEQNLSLLCQHVRKEPPYSFACSVGDVPKNVEKLIRGQVK